MHIILLSGGSGKRLWPLSNDIRSKQFIQMFPNEEGEYESMIQRVYRQIREVDPKAGITIATSKTQVSAIRNQLGDKVSVCVEPCRRDTFPAISLAAAYLQDELGIHREECVAVCPVDPFVDSSYFEGMLRLEKLVQEGASRLTLMGITPTYPSDKYGYILPEGKGGISPVKEFKEKPDRERAQQYIGQGALWNAGVFAARLGYLVDKAHERIKFEDYRDLFARYDSVEKISFDYAVAEKEDSIRVMSYLGEWKDVGTWNMVAEVMTEPIKGKGALDTSCRRTQIINELDIPVLCMGCKDMIVAVSSDGILVADKEQSSYMKPYVERIGDTVRYAEKSWGSYTVIAAQPGSMTIKVELKKGSRMKYHSHEMRDEVWTIISGKGRSIVEGMEQLVKPGDVVGIAAGCRHTLIAEEDMSAIEVQIGEEISKGDKQVFPLDNGQQPR